MRVARPLVVAHRGASAAWPEHTPAAMWAAIDAGADAVECDVRLSSDGVPVCVHDAVVQRTSNGRGRVSGLTLSQLRALDWGSWHPAGGGPSPTQLLTLAELVDLLLSAERPVGLLVETKHPSRFAGRVERAVLDVLRPVRGRLPLLAVMSFSALALRRLARWEPELARVRLWHRYGAHAPGFGRPAVAGLDIAQVRARPQIVTACRRRGWGVYVWTVDRPEDVTRCVEAGVDAIITNRPAEVRGQLRAMLPG